MSKPGTRAIALPNVPASVKLSARFETTPNGLILNGDSPPTLAEWMKAGRSLRVIEHGVQFAIGDFVNYGETFYGEKASQELDAESGWSLKTIRNYAWIARRIPVEIRRMGRLGIRHHQLVAHLGTETEPDVEKQREWLEKAAAEAEEKPWTVSRLKQAMREGYDLPASAWYVLVGCVDESAQRQLMDRLSLEGLSCKAVTRRKAAMADRGRGEAGGASQ